MAHWKRLTSSSTAGGKVDVNLDNVCYITQHEKYSTVFFAAAKSDVFLRLSVKESLDEIRAGESGDVHLA
jgi:hypothetical protein